MREEHRSRVFVPYCPSTSGPHCRRATDRCGMPTYAWSLAVVARGWLKLNQSSGSEEIRVLNSIRDAPISYAGQGRVVTTMLQRTAGSMIGRDGAGGLYVFFDRRTEVTQWTKMSDGSIQPAA